MGRNIPRLLLELSATTFLNITLTRGACGGRLASGFQRHGKPDHMYHGFSSDPAWHCVVVHFHNVRHHMEFGHMFSFL
jgi:hypothetical protein